MLNLSQSALAYIQAMFLNSIADQTGKVWDGYKARVGRVLAREGYKPLSLEGEFGLIIDAGDTCVKITMVDLRQVGDGTSNEVYIAHHMGEAGIGPKVHSWEFLELSENYLLAIYEMDKVVGTTLADYIQEDPFWWRTIPDKFLEMVRSIHSEGYLHGDLHRGNVIVTPEGRLVPIDWGYSKEYTPGDHYEYLDYTLAEVVPEADIAA